MKEYASLLTPQTFIGARNQQLTSMGVRVLAFVDTWPLKATAVLVQLEKERAFDLYSGNSGFCSWYGDQLTRLKFTVALFSPPRANNTLWY
jgi:hypothetical protein